MPLLNIIGTSGDEKKFLHIGENGELYNLGAVRVDWENGELSLRALSPQELYFDPASITIKTVKPFSLNAL